MHPQGEYLLRGIEELDILMRGECLDHDSNHHHSREMHT